MPLVYVRHADDDPVTPALATGAAPPEHDPPLNARGRRRALAAANALIALYGHPQVVYCSPFQRARQTVESMMGAFTGTVLFGVDPGLSRRFSKAEQRSPSISCDTWSMGPVPVIETSHEFAGRVDRHCKRVVARHFDRRPRSRDGDRGAAAGGNDPVVWCVTHALVMRRVAKRFRSSVPDEYVPFLGWMTVRRSPRSGAMRAQATHGLGRRVDPVKALRKRLGATTPRTSPSAGCAGDGVAAAATTTTAGDTTTMGQRSRADGCVRCREARRPSVGGRTHRRTQGRPRSTRSRYRRGRDMGKSTKGGCPRARDP